MDYPRPGITAEVDDPPPCPPNQLQEQDVVSRYAVLDLAVTADIVEGLPTKAKTLS
jgi:hypothetical protein